MDQRLGGVYILESIHKRSDFVKGKEDNIAIIAINPVQELSSFFSQSNVFLPELRLANYHQPSQNISAKQPSRTNFAPYFQQESILYNLLQL